MAPTATTPAGTRVTVTNAAGQIYTYQQSAFQPGKNIVVSIGFALGTTSNSLSWLGLTADASILDSTTNPPSDFAGFRFQSGTYGSDTNWQCVLASSGSNRTIADSGVAASTSLIRFRLIEDTTGGTNWHFFINGAEVCAGIGQANKPDSLMQPSLTFKNSGTAQTADFFWFWGSSDY